MPKTTLIVNGKTAQAERSIARLKTRVDSLSNAAGGIAIKAGAAFAGLSAIIGKSVMTWGVQEQAINSLNTSLANQGIFTEELSKKYQDLASAIQRKTKFGDEEIIQSQAVLQGYLGEKEITEDLLKAVTDFAQAKKVDLRTASELVGKSIGSTTNALSRYGIQVDTAKDKGGKLADVIKGITDQMGGQAEAAAMGTGVFKQLSNAFGDVQEVIGKELSPVLEDLAKRLIDIFERFQRNKPLVEFTAKAIAVGAAIAGVVTAVSSFLVVLPFLISGIAALGTAFSALSAILLANPIGLILTGISVAVAALAAAWKFNMFEIQETTFGVIGAVRETLKAFGVDVRDGAEGIKDSFELLKTSIIASAEFIIDKVLLLPKTLFKAMQQVFFILKGVAKDTAKIARSLGLKPEDVVPDSVFETIDKVIMSMKKGFKEGFDFRKKQNKEAAEEERKETDKTANHFVNRMGVAAETVKKKRKKEAKDGIEITLEEFRRAGGLFGSIFRGITDTQEFKSDMDTLNNEFYESLKPKPENMKEITDGIKKAFKVSDLARPFAESILPSGFGDLFQAGEDADPKAGFAALGNIMVSAFSKGAEIIADVFQAGPINRLSALLDLVGHIPEVILKAFKKLDKIVSDLIIALPRMVENLLKKLPGILDRIIRFMPQLVDLIGEMLVKVADVIAKTSPAITAAVTEGITQFIFFIPEIVEKLASSLGPVFQAFLSRVPDLVYAISEAIGPVVHAIAEQIAPIVEAFADNAAPIVLALVEGLTAAAGDIVDSLITVFLVEGGLERIVKAIIKAMPEIAAAYVKGIVKGTVAAGDTIGRSIGNGIYEASETIGAGIAREFSNSVEFPEIKIPEPSWVKDLRRATSSTRERGGGILSGLRFSEGGMVPKYLASGSFIPKGTDTVPAMLTPGERVLSVSQNERLIDAINNQTAKEINIKLSGEGIFRDLVERALVTSTATGVGRVNVDVGSET